MKTNARASKSTALIRVYLCLSVVLILPVLNGCSTFSRTPRWVYNPKSAYPEDQYLVAVGEGDTRRAAENMAAANLGRIFESQIESDERLLDQTTESGKKFERTTDFTADVNIRSSQTLFNIQHAEAWRDDKARYHAVAYLERQSTAVIYREKVNEQTGRVAFLLQEVETKSDPLERYAILRTAAQHDAEARYLLRQLKVIHQPAARAAEPDYSSSTLAKALAEAARNILVHIEIEGDSDGRMKSFLEELITDYGFNIGRPVVLNITGRVAVKDTGERTHGLVFVRYELQVQIRDTEGNVVVAVNEKGREAHNTLEQARARSFRTLENAIKAGGAQRLDGYFDSLIEYK
jgi:hypothetical protein